MIFYHCINFEVVCLNCSGVIQETLQHHKTFERFCPSLYHHISHLNAFPEYLDLLGVSDISEMPQGHGKPPANNPQIFSGQLVVSPFPQLDKAPLRIPSDQHRPSTSLSILSSGKACLPRHSLSICTIMPDTDVIIPDAPPIGDASLDDPSPIVPAAKKLPQISPRTIEHAHIKHLTRTKFLTSDPLKDQKYHFHAGQIADFCATDTKLCQHKVPDVFPVGYNKFAEVFNTHIENNPIRFATYDFKSKEFDLNGNPISIANFHITNEDIGIKPRKDVTTGSSEPKSKGKKHRAPEPLEPTPSSSNSAFTPLIVEPEPEPLTPKRAKVVESLLWHAAETLQKQQQRFESTKAAHLQRKNDATLLAAACARSSTS